MNKYEEIAARLIDEISEEVERQHPEIKLKTKYAKDNDVLDDPSLICGIGYYNLENSIARQIKEFNKRKK